MRILATGSLCTPTHPHRCLLCCLFSCSLVGRRCSATNRRVNERGRGGTYIHMNTMAEPNVVFPSSALFQCSNLLVVPVLVPNGVVAAVQTYLPVRTCVRILVLWAGGWQRTHARTHSRRPRTGMGKDSRGHLQNGACVRACVRCCFVCLFGRCWCMVFCWYVVVRWLHGITCLLYTSPSPRDRG